MSQPKELQELLSKLVAKEALIIDDAYDIVPKAEALEGLALNLASEDIRKASVKVRVELAKVLDGLGFEEDDFEGGFGADEFVAAVWKLREVGKLKGRRIKELFDFYQAEQDQKRAGLAPLVTLLKDTLGFQVETQGSSQAPVSRLPRLILLDLFLSFKDEAQAVESSIARIEQLLDGAPETGRPLIVVMSTKGEKLSSLGMQLKEKAGLMGSKFRTVAKSEVSDVLPRQLEEMLDGLEKAELYAGWLEAWKEGVQQARDELVKKLRLLDLSDLAYLVKYRLEVEGMPLGTYLRKLAEDRVVFQLEGSERIEKCTLQMNTVVFDKMPRVHFLPSEQIPRLKHSSCFVNETLLRAEGYQFADAKGKLVLGDLIIEGPAGWKAGTVPSLNEGMEVLVVLSQACDILQCKTDSILFLKGRISKRKWIDVVGDQAEMTDVFFFSNEKFQINWDKAQITAWTLKQANIRLAPKSGKYLRIARFREVEAIKLQNLFASNLTRVGTFATPHQHWEVGLKVQVPLKAGGLSTLLEIPQSDAPAALIETREAGKSSKGLIIVFEPGFAKTFAAACRDFDWSSIRPPYPAHFKAFWESEESLGIFAKEEPAKTLPFGKFDLQIITKGKVPDNNPSMEILGGPMDSGARRVSIARAEQSR